MEAREGGENCLPVSERCGRWGSSVESVAAGRWLTEKDGGELAGKAERLGRKELRGLWGLTKRWNP